VEEVLSFGGTGSGSDIALILKGAGVWDMFSRDKAKEAGDQGEAGHAQRKLAVGQGGANRPRYWSATTHTPAIRTRWPSLSLGVHGRSQGWRSSSGRRRSRGLPPSASRGVEIIAHGPCYHVDVNFTDERAEYVKRLLIAHKLETSAISPATEFLRFDEDGMQAQIEHMRKVVNLCVRLGADHVRIFAGGRFLRMEHMTSALRR